MPVNRPVIRCHVRRGAVPVPGGARVFAFTTRPSLRTKEPNLNPPGGLRGDGLAGSLANQEQDGNNPTHMP
jgi:hypothetical protein